MNKRQQHELWVQTKREEYMQLLSEFENEIEGFVKSVEPDLGFALIGLHIETMFIALALKNKKDTILEGGLAYFSHWACLFISGLQDTPNEQIVFDKLVDFCNRFLRERVQFELSVKENNTAS